MLKNLAVYLSDSTASLKGFANCGLSSAPLGEDPIWVPRRLTRILKDASMDDDVPDEPADAVDEPTAGEDGAKMGDPVGVSEAEASPA
ncbi:hypothetical protein STEG23_007241 [Scotinomys teguina]